MSAKGFWPEDHSIRYPDDVARMVRVVDWLTPGTANWLWGEYSYHMMASWLVLPERDDVLYGILEGFTGGYSARARYEADSLETR